MGLTLVFVYLISGTRQTSIKSNLKYRCYCFLCCVHGNRFRNILCPHQIKFPYQQTADSVNLAMKMHVEAIKILFKHQKLYFMTLRIYYFIFFFSSTTAFNFIFYHFFFYSHSTRIFWLEWFSCSNLFFFIFRFLSISHLNLFNNHVFFYCFSSFILLFLIFYLLLCHSNSVINSSISFQFSIDFVILCWFYGLLLRITNHYLFQNDNDQ